MKAIDMKEEGSITRRDFVKSASMAATAAATGFTLKPESVDAATPQAAADKIMIGFQAEVSYVLKYGITHFSMIFKPAPA